MQYGTTEYYCTDARRALCDAMPAQYEAIRNSPCGAAVESLMRELWRDAVSCRQRAKLEEDPLPGDAQGINIVMQHVPEEQQRHIEEFVPDKIVEGRELAMLSTALMDASRPLFRPCHRDLVAGLCVRLHYIDAQHEALLGGIRNDVQHDPLELFQAAEGNTHRSRFEALFLDAEEQCARLRRLFLNITVQTSGGEQEHLITRVMREAASDMTRLGRDDEAAMLQAICIASGHVYEQKCCALPAFPPALTEAMAWSVLREAWRDERY